MKQTCDMGHWVCSFAFDPEAYVGFIYQITDKVTGKAYIGRKNLTSTRRKQVKCKTDTTKKKTVRVTKPSDWTSYTSSSVQLNEAIQLYGKQRFRFEILSAHKSKSALNYAEVYQLVMRGALTKTLPGGEPAYWNGLIPPVRTRPCNDK